MRFLTPAELRGLDARALEELLAGTELVVAMAGGDVRGNAAAALLFADFAVLDARATLHLDAPAVWAGAVWRLGRRALLLLATQSFDAAAARAKELCDDVTERAPQEWLDGWMKNRSPIALDAAAMLIRSRGGDALERAEFARLFALGEPQKGLAAFLRKERPDFGS